MHKFLWLGCELSIDDLELPGLKFEGLEFPDDAEFFDGLSADLAVLGVGG